MKLGKLAICMKSEISVNLILSIQYFIFNFIMIIFIQNSWIRSTYYLPTSDSIFNPWACCKHEKGIICCCKCCKSINTPKAHRRPLVIIFFLILVIILIDWLTDWLIDCLLSCLIMLLLIHSIVYSILLLFPRRKIVENFSFISVF